MDVKLVLSAPAGRIDRKTDRRARHHPPHRALGKAARFPCQSKIIRRVRLQQRRTLDSAQAGRRYQQILRDADPVLVHRIAALGSALQSNERAWRRARVLGFVGNALVVDDLPQAVAVKGPPEAKHAEQDQRASNRRDSRAV